MQLGTHAEIEVARPAERVFDFAVACETFTRVLLPLGPLPGVQRAEMLDGAEPKAGARRRILLSDGTSVLEELLAFERPLRHCYRWVEPPRGALALLVRGADGDWRFSTTARGTRIAWSYRFELSSALAAPLALPIVWLFRSWMKRGLERVREALEAG